MIQISKAEFIRRITENKTIFMGISPACDNSEISAVRRNRLERHGSHARSCRHTSNYHLIFDNDSHLYLSDIKPHTEIKCYAISDDVLVVEQKYTSQYYGFPDEISYKYLYYSIVKECTW